MKMSGTSQMRWSSWYHLVTVPQMLLQQSRKSGFGRPPMGLVPVKIAPRSVRA